MNAIVSNVLPQANEDTNSPEIHCDVFFYGGDMTYTIISSLIIPFGSTDTVNQIGAKLSAAVDAEAQRMNLGTPTAVLAPSFSRLR